MKKCEMTVAEYLMRIEARQQNLEKLMLSKKSVLTFAEAAIYMDVSSSHLYKLTMARLINFYKPRGKMIYFDLNELESWLLQNRVSTADEIEAKANAHVLRNK